MKYKKRTQYQVRLPGKKVQWSSFFFEYIAHDEKNVVLRDLDNGLLTTQLHEDVRAVPMPPDEVFKRHVRRGDHLCAWQEVKNILERNGVEVILKTIEG